MGLFDGYFDSEQSGEGGGLLSRLIAMQRQQGRYQPGTGSDRRAADLQAPADAPPFWSDLPVNGQAQPPAPDLHTQYQALLPMLGDRHAMLATINPDIGKSLIAEALARQHALGNSGVLIPASNSGPVVSDASPDPVRPGSQYAQAAMRLCATGPFGCAGGAALTAGQAILGGGVLGGLGALILNNRDST